MANEEHLAILMQGVEVWNRWRRKNSHVRPDLSGENFIRLHLGGADLSSANFSGAHLSSADLSSANLIDIDLNGAHLCGTFLKDARLRGANLIGANLSGANLNGSNLIDANLSDVYLYNTNLKASNLKGVKFDNTKFGGADFKGANFSSALLDYTEFKNVSLIGTIFSNSRILNSAFNDCYLNDVIGMGSIKHLGPSSISTDTLIKSGGKIPAVFLRGCGLSDWEIESAKLYNPNLTNEEINDINYKIYELRASRIFQINPLFISYSHKDSDFVDAIEKRLINQGIRFWRDVHHAKAGRLELQIDQAIHLNDVVLLVLSEHSTSSDWVQHEARKAREKELKTGKDALCPIALDGSWKACRWPQRLREQIEEYNVLDFSQWQDAASFDRMFARLIEGLGIFYK